MLEKIKHLFIKEKIVEAVVPSSYKHVLISIHGFGRKRSTEMSLLKKLADDNNYLFVSFDLFEVDEPNPNFEDWIQCAEKELQKYMKLGYMIDLLGFSMGGVIASFLASKYPNQIHRLVLLSPAFDYMSMNSAGKLVAFSTLSMIKDSDSQFVKDLKARILPVEYFPQFFDLVKKYKKYISEVKCPVLFMHGDSDETVPIRSSKNAMNLIAHNDKRLIILAGGKHQILLDEILYEDIFTIIDLFLDEKIVKKGKDVYNSTVQINEED